MDQKVRATVRAAGAVAVTAGLLAAGATSAGAAAVEQGPEHRIDRLSYSCATNGTSSWCQGSASPSKTKVRWSVTEVAPNEWIGSGTVGRKRVTWTVSGVTVGQPGGAGYETPRMSWSGEVDQARGESFTFYQGGYVPGGSMQAYVSRPSGSGTTVGCDTDSWLPALGASCTAYSDLSMAEIVAVAPVYPGAELVFPAA